MRIDIDVAKVPKHDCDISGDTVDVVERRDGGLSLIIADGMGSTADAKFTSSFVVNKAMSLIAEGTRDGAASRAAHDALYSVRSGKASVGLTIVSADFATNSLVVSRNSHCPVLVKRGDELLVYQESVSQIGTEQMVKPNIYVLDLVPDTTVVTFTDGFMQCGGKGSAGWELKDIVMEVKQDLARSGSVAMTLLDKALARDKNKPKDDISVAVMSVSPHTARHKIRRMQVSMPT
jgi:serine phosphatase RsbU (regulator of sigma subunit)